MRVVMATFGTAGDVTPFLEVGQLLARRGHDVEVVTDQAHRAAAEGRGLRPRTPIHRYDPVTLTSNPRYAQAGLGPYRLWRDIFVPLVPEMFHAVSAALRRPTQVVLVHPWCHGALYAAEAAGVPVASLAMAPLTWWSSADPALYTHHRLPPLLHRALLRGPVRWFFNLFFGPGLSRARRALGLPAKEHPFFALGRDSEASYGLWSPMLRDRATDDPRGAAICGFLRGQQGTPPLPAALEAFLASGRTPVVVGMGSLIPPMAGDVYAAARHAARALDQRVVLVGASQALSGTDVLVIEQAPYSTLFPRARAVIHHGGAGTLQEALRAGRPQVIVPFGNDQFDNACRAERLGVARWAPRRRFTSEHAKELLAWALREPVRQAAIAAGATVEAEPDGAEVVVDDLERRFQR